jgi:uncharacterized protein
VRLKRGACFLLLASLAACGAEPLNNIAQAPGGAAAAAAKPDPRAQTGLEVIPLTIATRSGARHQFRVEVARTPDQQAMGLMFRMALAPDAGMLFPMHPPRPAYFWMRNTYIPLDMLFIRADGTIARIAADTVPHSEESVGVAEPVAAVLEIPAGRSAELGIREGDRVSW